MEYHDFEGYFYRERQGMRGNDMTQRIIAQFADKCGCSVTGTDEKQRVAFGRCKLHAAAPELLEALKGLREDLQVRLDASTEGTTVADGLVSGEDANRSWRSWLFDVMRTHGDIARDAIEAAK
ncbi:hypothetical protein LCGC14_1182740 [marine sediment metagenome]|uniref:Uncharacterized protein n=1 Tax=marine sediment metagenome TaxID=412755 RepID=A0A0F9M9D0_9ZZZZ